MTQKTANKPFNLAIKDELVESATATLNEHPELDSIVVTLAYNEDCGDPAPRYIVVSRQLEKLSTLQRILVALGKTLQDVLDNSASFIGELAHSIQAKKGECVEKQQQERQTQADRETDTKGSTD